MTTSNGITFCTTADEVRECADQGRRWVLCLAYVGANPENVSGHSRKFWALSGLGYEDARCLWGRIGNKPQSKAVDLATGIARLLKKMAKGYAPVSASIAMACGAAA